MAKANKDSSKPTRKRKHVASDILLVGQPNVGKSVLFSRMTGIRTIASNYPGTTVGYTSGRMRFANDIYDVVDAPGTYSLEPLDDAAKVAVDLIDEARRIINVVDATHLERHLTLTLELIAQGKPMVVALNMSDEARHKGIEIDVSRLAKRLGVPVIPTVARTGEGVKRLILATLSLDLKKIGREEGGHPGHHPHIAHHPVGNHTRGHKHIPEKKAWTKVGEIVDEVQILHHHHHTFGQWFEEASVHPVWGGLVAILVLAVSFILIRIIGEFLIGGGIGIVGNPWVELPFGTEKLFEVAWKPVMMKLSGLLGEGSFLHNLFIGQLIGGQIDFMQSFGILTSGLFIPLGAVLPYIVSFYFVLGILEDTGYLPRLAVFLDNIMHRLGLHGYAIIPTLLGLGCNVPGVMATRILETKRQRFITATLISIAVPCAALQAMIIGLVGERGLWPVALIYGILFVVWILIGVILRFTSKGFRPELLIEIPPYRAPSWRALGSKLWMRITGFLKEALPVVLGAVVVVNLLYQFNVFRYIARAAAPVVSFLWGLPKEAIAPLLVGILRKDVAIGMFAPLNLTIKQLVIGSVVLSMFFPCIATFVIMFRELGLKDALKSIGIMFIAVIIVGTAINFLWPG
ncbi:ferrous iron transporter B [candidate division TA06 bacterium B3_TA06]|uniref:Ferrous iron transporter B n=1 Tax=candidate division TA06 bacterium B3_TA06 TaxID=2012487 RepID=A0A532V9P5_UNCT6|nr:MAG: ferrous iron transporter B [candidate division TA06 bacterium B3_TA06]